MSIPEILTRLGEFGILVAAIAWLAKKIITHQLSKDMEVFKADLQKESQREIESLKSVLEQRAYEHQVRFSRLHEKRAKVIEETYANLVDLYDVSNRFLARFPYRKGEVPTVIVQGVLKTTSRFMTHFERHRIYFDSDVSEKIIRLNEAILGALDVPFADAIGAPVVGDCLTRDFINEMKDRIPPIKADLENAFRELLGVIEPKNVVDAPTDKN